MPAATEDPETKPQGQDDAGGDAPQRTSDPRCSWFEDVVVRGLKIKNEKFKKLMMMPDNS